MHRESGEAAQGDGDEEVKPTAAVWVLCTFVFFAIGIVSALLSGETTELIWPGLLAYGINCIVFVGGTWLVTRD